MWEPRSLTTPMGLHGLLSDSFAFFPATNRSLLQSDYVERNVCMHISDCALYETNWLAIKLTNRHTLQSELYWRIVVLCVWCNKIRFVDSRRHKKQLLHTNPCFVSYHSVTYIVNTRGHWFVPLVMWPDYRARGKRLMTMDTKNILNQ
jgi:hypothetical protein